METHVRPERPTKMLRIDVRHTIDWSVQLVSVQQANSRPAPDQLHQKGYGNRDKRS